MDDYEAYFDSLEEGEEVLSYEEYRVPHPLNHPLLCVVFARLP